MPYALRCDSCGFTEEIDDELDTYGVAKDHESANQDHFVFIERQA
jgi:hypothetical protein